MIWIQGTAVKATQSRLVCWALCLATISNGVERDQQDQAYLEELCSGWALLCAFPKSNFLSPQQAVIRNCVPQRQSVVGVCVHGKQTALVQMEAEGWKGSCFLVVIYENIPPAAVPPLSGKY